MAESRRDEIAKLEALYASNPEGRVFTHLAEAYRRAGELERARETLERGLERHPDYPSAHVVLGRVHADLGHGEEAAASFRRVLQLDPENLIARRSLAEAARSAGHDEDALRHYRELLEQDPSAFEVREIIDELQSRLQGPAAPPPVMPSSWSTSRDEESWDAPEPVAPAGDDGGFDLGGTHEAIDLSGVFGEATPEPADTSPFEPEPLDLSGIDFGGGITPPAEPEASVESGHDASGWGNWPGQPESVPADVEPGSETASETGEEATEPVHTGEPEPFSGRPSVEAPFEEEAEASGYAAATPAFQDDRHEAETAPSSDEGAAETPSYEAEEFAAETPSYEAEEIAVDTPSYEREDDGAETASYEPGEFAAETSSYEAEDEAAEALPESAANGLADVTAFDHDAAASHEIPSYEYDETAAPSHPVGHDEPEPVEAPAAADEFGAFGVPTATLAALYEAQGFPDRAASVYRALLRDHPDDERLRERARAADEAAAVLRAQRTGIEETREVWVSAESWESESGPTAYAWDADEDDDGAADGPSIGEYLGRVLSWRPSGEIARPDAAGQQAAADTDELVAPWEPEEEHEDRGEHDTLGGFVFGEPTVASSEVAEPAAPEQARFEPQEVEPELEPEAEPELESEEAAPSARMDIEYGYGLAPGESAFGAHPPEAPPAERALHLDTLLPLPPEEQIEGEQPATWFEPEPAAEPDAEPSRAALPFELDETGEEFGEERGAEPLPFDFEEIGTEPGYPAAEPLPFDLAALGADVDDTPGEPLPFELSESDEAEPLPFEQAGSDEAEPLPFELAGSDEAEPLPFELAGSDQVEPLPFELDGPERVEPLLAESGADESLLELQEAEAVSEAAQPSAEIWDPTIALADVAPRPHAHPEARLRFEGGSRSESAPAQRAEDEEEDEDLEMFRTWLQSLKR